MGRVGIALFGLVFAAAGTAMFVFFTFLPIYGIIDARDWVATPCTITASEVETHSDSDGDTYRIKIEFDYEYNGKTYRGDRYRFAAPGSSSGYRGKKKVVDAHPVGSTQTCYINPDDPSQAVIERGLHHGLWLGLFPLPFMAIGYGILLSMLIGTRSPRASSSLTNTSRKQVDWLPDTAEQTGQATLTPGGKRVLGFVGLLLFTLLWNGFVGTFIYLGVIQDAGSGIDWCVGLFMVPFVIAGLFMATQSFRMLMLIFAPRIVLDLSQRAIPLGGSARLRWHTEGAITSVNRVTILLIGKESATYTRGTDTVTDTQTFYEQVLNEDDLEPSDFETLRSANDRGEVEFVIPAETMHSFEAGRNKVTWKLRVIAEVSRWPDPKDEYEIAVLPATQ